MQKLIIFFVYHHFHAKIQYIFENWFTAYAIFKNRRGIEAGMLRKTILSMSRRGNLPCSPVFHPQLRQKKMETSERKDVDSCDWFFFIPPVKLLSIYSPHHPGSFSQNWGLSKTSVSCCYATKKGPKYYARHFEKTSLYELELYVKGWRDSFDFR